MGTPAMRITIGILVFSLCLGMNLPAAPPVKPSVIGNALSDIRKDTAKEGTKPAPSGWEAIRKPRLKPAMRMTHPEYVITGLALDNRCRLIVSLRNRGRLVDTAEQAFHQLQVRIGS